MQYNTIIIKKQNFFNTGTVFTSACRIYNGKEPNLCPCDFECDSFPLRILQVGAQEFRIFCLSLPSKSAIFW